MKYAEELLPSIADENPLHLVEQEACRPARLALSRQIEQRQGELLEQPGLGQDIHNGNDNGHSQALDNDFSHGVSFQWLRYCMAHVAYPPSPFLENFCHQKPTKRCRPPPPHAKAPKNAPRGYIAPLAAISATEGSPYFLEDCFCS
jgi:hypothetical protein